MASQQSDQAPTSSQLPFASSPESSTPTMNSEDSDTVLLNKPEDSQSAASSTNKRPPPPSRASTLGIKKCWICIGDSTEDDPSRAPRWRSPCTCNLTAHEDCLLDWVADLENPVNRKRNPPPTKILCPQCKSEIKIARPRSYIVDAARGIDRAVGRLVLPTLGLSLFGTIWTGACIHGISAVWVVFGDYQAQMIFRNAVRHGMGNVAAYGLIPLSLTFSRSKYADFILPGGTLFLLSTQLRDSFEIDMTIWPPKPSTVFACLPAIRSGYNWCYEKAFGELNRKWIAEVQPRQGEDTDGEEAAEAAAEEIIEEAAAGGGGFVVELDINIGGEEEAEEAEDDEDGEDGPPPAGAAANDNFNGDAGDGVHQIFGPRGEEIVEGTSSLGDFVAALAFPWLAAGMGGLVSYTLPAAWMTNANWMNGRPGFLRHRWGRTVVGGMALVVLKDAVMLYCRWRVAKSFRQRRIMDFDKAKKEYKLNA